MSLFCKIGWHKWSDWRVIKDPTPNWQITTILKECKRCSAWRMGIRGRTRREVRDESAAALVVIAFVIVFVIVMVSLGTYSYYQPQATCETLIHKVIEVGGCK